MRLVTRPDFDGLVCGALITAMEEIGPVLFVESKWMQDGMVGVRHGDIITNLPFHPRCTLWFDHHLSNKVDGFEAPFVPGEGAYRLASSAARVVFEYCDRMVPESRPRDQVVLEKIRSDRFTKLLKVSNDTHNPERTAISAGCNIFNGTSNVNVGALMQKYGGGGHRVVGSCRVAKAEADPAIAQMLEAMTES